MADGQEWSFRRCCRRTRCRRSRPLCSATMAWSRNVLIRLHTKSSLMLQRHTFSKVLDRVPLYSRCTRPLTNDNFNAMQEEDEGDYCRTIEEQVRVCLLSARVSPTPPPLSPALDVDQEQCTRDTRYLRRAASDGSMPSLSLFCRPLSLFVAKAHS